VAVTVAPAVPFDPEAWGPVPVGVSRRRSRLTDVLDVGRFGEAEFVRELTAIGELRSQLAA